MKYYNLNQKTKSKAENEIVYQPAYNKPDTRSDLQQIEYFQQQKKSNTAMILEAFQTPMNITGDFQYASPEYEGKQAMNCKQVGRQ